MKKISQILFVLLFTQSAAVLSQSKMMLQFHYLPQEKSIELPGNINLSYVEQGNSEGLPVIFLHGYTDSWHSYDSVLRNLPKKGPGRPKGSINKFHRSAKEAIAELRRKGIKRIVMLTGYPSLATAVKAIKNGAAHGNQFSVSKLLKFRCVKDERRIVVQVTDQGEGFDWKEKLKIGFEIVKDPKRCELFLNQEVEKTDPYMGKIGKGLLTIIKNVPSVEFNHQGNSIILTHLIWGSGTYRAIT